MNVLVNMRPQDRRAQIHRAAHHPARKAASLPDRSWVGSFDADQAMSICSGVSANLTRLQNTAADEVEIQEL
jgi:hypothetical protein